MIRRTGGDALLCTASTDAIAEAAAAWSGPVVNFAGNRFDDRWPSVIGDGRAIGAMAAEHLIERRVPGFAFVGNAEMAFRRDRRAGFVTRVAEAGHEAATFDTAGDLAASLASLPRPLGVFAGGDNVALDVLRAMHEGGVSVPDEVLVIGAGNHEDLCELALPPLSSVDGDFRRRGREAAAVMTRLLSGEPPPAEPVLVPPLMVVGRRSSDHLAIDDEQVVRALRVIRDHADEPMDVEGIVAATDVSRRTLEKRFAAAVGRSLHEELWRRRIELAKRLLLGTDLSVLEVALRSGFTSASAISHLFKRHTGVTPTRFRRDAGAAAAARKDR